MYVPKQDDAFGGCYFYRGTGVLSNGSYYQSYTLTRTRWKTLNTATQRCDEGKSAANTTKCITRYLERTIGCSLGLHGTDPGVKR